MIYLFTWNSSYLLSEQVKSWKQHFVSKYWDFNLIHIKDIKNTDNDFLIENISSSSFLSEKKLVIIDLNEDIPKEKEELLIKFFDKIPEENIILFNWINLDKRSKFYKELIKTAELKEFNTKDDNDLQKIISNKYWNKLSPQAINTIIKYKSWNLSKIISEIDKLLITYNKIDSKEIIENIKPELEESIFLVIDDILNNKINDAIKKIDIILNDTNIYALYNNLIANLRTSVFILKLKEEKENNITDILWLWNRTFLINKSYKLSYKSVRKIYIKLVNIDKKMKSWKLVWTEDIDFRFELEKSLLN